jgi:poly(A) polymerase
MHSEKIKKTFENEIFKIISETAAELQMPAYVIGGFVRDLFLNKQSKDIDIVVLGSGIEIAKKVAAKLGVYKVTVFKTFGTAMFVHNETEYEFVGARKESYSKNSRKPIVENGTLIDDQNRRDFTINALAISLNKIDYCSLIDPFNGLEDLNTKILKTPMDASITYSDDPLRMLRAIRFSSQLGFQIEEKSLKAIQKNKERIKIISAERISTELNKIILSKKPSVGFKLLLQTGLLEIIFPEMFNLLGVDEIDGKKHKDNFFHTLQVLDNISKNTDDLWLRWASILHDIAKPLTKKYYPETGWTFHGHEDRGARMVPEIFKTFKLPLDHKMKYVQKLVALHLRPIALTKEIATDSAIRRLLYDAGDTIDDLMILCQADITSKNEVKVKQYLKNYETVKQKLIAVEAKDKIRNWQPPVSGELIMKTFGIKPSPEVGLIKNSIREAILEGEIQNNYSDAFAFMLKKATEHGLVMV